MTNRFRLSQQLKQMYVENTLLKYKWFNRYHLLLSSTVERYQEHMLNAVVTTQFLVLVLAHLFFWLITGNLFFTVMFSFAFVVVVPLFVLYMMLYMKRADAQSAIYPAVLALYHRYQQHNQNMNYALKEVLKDLDGKIKMIFTRYYLTLQKGTEYRSKAKELLAFEIGEPWGKHLANLLDKALTDGVSISDSFHDLTQDMSEFRKKARDAQSEGREIVYMGLFPLVGMPVVFLINSYFSVGSVFEYYFRTDLGLQVTAITLLFALVGVSISVLYTKPRGY
jgi:Flp pilus assembly protein TadB